MANKKMTKREMLAQILAHTTDIAEREFLAHEIELLDTKKATKKPTAEQVKNEEIKEAIIDYLLAVDYSAEDMKNGLTIGDMIAKIPACEGLSSQKVTTLVSALVKADKLTRVEVKGKAYFSA